MEKQLQKVTLTKVSVTNKKKDGTQMPKSKNGNQGYKIGIQCNEYGDKWLNSILYFQPKWKEGDTIDIEYYEEEYNGKIYKKFDLPRAFKVTREMWDSVVDKIKELETKIETENPSDAKNPDDPF